jgi:hypothetical protein
VGGKGRPCPVDESIIRIAMGGTLVECSWTPTGRGWVFAAAMLSERPESGSRGGNVEEECALWLDDEDEDDDFDGEEEDTDSDDEEEEEDDDWDDDEDDDEEEDEDDDWDDEEDDDEEEDEEE